VKTYLGYRLGEMGGDGSHGTRRCVVRVREPGHAEYALPPRLDIRAHSPDGFEWGYGGSGPAQLALALVADCRGDAFAVPKIYQRVKKAIAKLPRDGWTLTFDQVDWLIAAAVAETGFVPELADNFFEE
jgi:hypothetical protein